MLKDRKKWRDGGGRDEGQQQQGDRWTRLVDTGEREVEGWRDERQQQQQQQGERWTRLVDTREREVEGWRW